MAGTGALGDNSGAALATLGEQCADFALQSSDVAGFVGEVHQRIARDHQRLSGLRQGVGELSRLQGEANEAAAEVRDVAARADILITESHRAIGTALADIGALIEDVLRMGERLEGFVAAIEKAGSISGGLDAITRQTGLLAINATIEAARAGDQASGFAVVASEVKRLAGQARQETAHVTDSLHGIETSARGVIEDVRASVDRGRAARARAGEITGALETIAALVSQFDQRTGEIERCGVEITDQVGAIESGLGEIASSAESNSRQLTTAGDRLDELEGRSNAMLNMVAHNIAGSGVETRDGRYVEMARAQARQVRGVIAEALGSARLDVATLFDSGHRARPGSNPPQYDAPFADFADRAIRPLLDGYTHAEAAIVGCCLVDRRGWLPTHITERSQPQRPDDRRWNIEYARNRQLFMDKQTRAALDGDGDWFLFTYRQDFGDGRYRALRSVFVPLVFEGRKWGLYELGYLI